jgi:hypothetical protein
VGEAQKPHHRIAVRGQPEDLKNLKSNHCSVDPRELEKKDVISADHGKTNRISPPLVSSNYQAFQPLLH